MKLKNKYQSICKEYIDLFCEKQGLEYDYSVVDDLGGVSSFDNEWFFNLDDIRLDIDLNAPKGLIIDWYDSTLERNDRNPINYNSWIKGARYDNK